MAINETLLAAYDQEVATTRNLLRRVPGKDAAWMPARKSDLISGGPSHVDPSR